MRVGFFFSHQDSFHVVVQSWIPQKKNLNQRGRIIVVVLMFLADILLSWFLNAFLIRACFLKYTIREDMDWESGGSCRFIVCELSQTSPFNEPGHGS